MTNMTPKDRASNMWAAIHYDIAGCCINDRAAAHAATKAAIIAAQHIKSLMYASTGCWQEVEDELQTYFDK